eukprot:gene5342-5729_t
MSSQFNFFDHFLFELYPAIQCYLSYEDTFYFYNASKGLFSEAKKSYIYYPLNIQKSKEYFIPQTLFREFLIKQVKDPLKQISLRCSEWSLDLIALTPSIPAHRLTIVKAGSGDASWPFKYYSQMTLVEEMHQISSSSITSFPTLPRLKILTLYHLYQLTDVSGLSNLRNLELHFCSSVVSVACLKDIPNLLIEKCHAINDFHTLTKQKRLKVSRCPNLRSVESFKNIEQVIINDCQNVADFSPLSMTNVQHLTLGFLEKVAHYQELGNTKNTVVFNGTDRVKDFSCLLNFRHVTVRLLHYFHTVMTSHGEYFRCLQSICLDCCNGIKEVKGFQDIPQVFLIHLPSLVDISGLGRNRYVRIVNCGELEDVGSLKNVPRVTIFGCRKIPIKEVLFILRDVARLRVA